MTTRICPSCGEPAHSADEKGVWKCPSCGAEIPSDEIERAIEYYDRHIAECKEAVAKYEVPGFRKALSADIKRETLILAALREKQERRWIPITERLPEPETSVLIWQSYREDSPYANITIGHLHQERDFRRKPYWTWIAYGADMAHPKIEAYHRTDFICPGNEFVAHWMPLPEPPKEDKQNG
jgi:predicted RNA-binding Zn-ribbon protein involved in translation (DUF1610 family)